MPAVFVHGVPDTSRVWHAVIARLPRQDVVTLALPGREWAGDLARVTAPGLVLWGEGDPYAASRFGERLAERTGARFVCFPGCSHWWQLECPDAVASELDRFWTHIRPGEPRDA